MLWMILGCICLAYYAILEYASKGQPMTILWLVLAVLFLLLYLYGKYRKKHPGPVRPLWFRTFCTTSLILFLILIGVVESRILTTMLAYPEPDLKYIVVLSQNETSGETGVELKTRLDYAAAYLKVNPNTCVIVSGGWDSDKGSSKAHTMYQYLLSCGIENQRISWEVRSVNTEENIENSMSISGGPEVPLGIVVSDYFAYRSVRMARSVGLAYAEPLPTATPLWLLPHRLAQELLHVLHDKFLGS